MKSKKRLIMLAFVLAALIGVAGFAYGKLAGMAGGQNNLVPSAEERAEGEADSEVKKVKAANFTVTDVNGNNISLTDFEGKPVIVNFWASWCGPCQMEMPDFEEKYKEYGEEIHFIMLNVTDGSRETVDTAKDFIAGTDYTFPIYFDTQLEASGAYRVYSLPTTIFIDADGYGIAQATGMINAELLQKGIDMIYTPTEE